MVIDAMEVKIKKNDIKKFERNNIPLMSKVVQLNTRIKNTTLKYVEHKIITYDIFIKTKGKNIFKQDINRSKVTILVNTHTGISKSINKIPNTYKLNISRSIIKKSEIDEVNMLENITNELTRTIKNKVLKGKCHIQDIKIQDIKSIYKPYWVGTYNGKSVLLEA